MISQVATLTEQLAAAKANTATAEEKVVQVAAAAAQLAVEEQEKAEQRMSEIRCEAAVSAEHCSAGEAEEEGRLKKPKQKQMTLDSMLPKHPARARKLEEAMANSAEEAVAPQVVSAAEQGEEQEGEWCGLSRPAPATPFAALLCPSSLKGIIAPDLTCPLGCNADWPYVCR